MRWGRQSHQRRDRQERERALRTGLAVTAASLVVQDHRDARGSIPGDRVQAGWMLLGGCAVGLQIWGEMGGNGTYCTFGPRARTVISEFSDFHVL